MWRVPSRAVPVNRPAPHVSLRDLHHFTELLSSIRVLRRVLRCHAMRRGAGMWQRRLSNNLLNQPSPPPPPSPSPRGPEIRKRKKERKKLMEEGSQSERRRAAPCWQLTSCERGRRKMLCVSVTANLTATAYIFSGIC